MANLAKQSRYSAAVIQGIALVTFPAASTVFTSPSYYDLSNTAYGAMFVPQAVTAVAASLLGAGLGRRWGIKRLYLLGLAADLVRHALAVAEPAVITEQPLAYGMLLLATASLGIGFGLTVPSLNTFAAAFVPSALDRAVLILNALLGLGTALAPVFVAVFVGLGIWRGLPLLVALLLLGLLRSACACRSARHHRDGGRRAAARRPKVSAPCPPASGSSPASRCSTASSKP